MTRPSLIWLHDSVTAGFTPLTLEILSLVSIIFAVLVILVKNPISSILYLIALFFSMACYLCLLGLTFLGLSYILVYVGAISILFLFILMLINIRVSELAVNTSNSIPLVLVISIFFFFAFKLALPYNWDFELKYKYLDIIPLFGYITSFSNNWDFSDNKIYFASSNCWDGNITEFTHITSIGNIMYTSYFVWLILISVILLLAMVGCIVITL